MYGIRGSDSGRYEYELHRVARHHTGFATSDNDADLASTDHHDDDRLRSHGADEAEARGERDR